jgi:hypothetical protein
LAACYVQVSRVLDLSDAAVRRLLSVKAQQLKTEPWRAEQHAGREALTQAIGRVAREAYFQGLLTMSARRQLGRNLTLFRERVTHAEVQVIHPESFPKRRRRR